MRSCACWAISAPWSQVSDRRSCSGSVDDLFGDRVADRLGAVTGERRPVLDPRLEAMAFHRRQAQQHREPGGAFDERADRRAVQAEDEVAFPVAGNGPIFDLGGAFADHDLRCDELLAASAGASSRHPKRPTGSQASDQLALERAAALDEERLIDRLVGDAHGLIIGEVDPETVRDLFRAPRLRPAPVGAPSVTAADEAHLGPATSVAVGSSDRRRRGDPARSLAAVRCTTSFATFGRLARRSACHCAVVAR